MAVSSRIIKRRIKSVANTRKITKAMELVAASKMRRAVQMTLASRSYSTTMTAMVADVRSLIDSKSHVLLAGRGSLRSTLVIAAASDRGLCGGFNTQLLKKTLEFFKTRSEEKVNVITVGKRAEAAVRRAGKPILASFEAISNAPGFDRTRPIGDLAYREFIEGRTDRVFLVFTDFRSAVSQIPAVMQLLPIIPEAELSKVVEANGHAEDLESEGEDEPDEPNILFEPEPKQLLDALLPRLIETQVYQALLESAASEHSARMMAMRSATDNASDMLQDLTLTFNQARQASITREISEISAGKAAIE